MKLRYDNATLASTLIAGALSVHLLGQEPSPRPRVVQWTQAPIASLLREGDQVVVIADESNRVGPVFNGSTDFLEYVTSNSALVLEARLIGEEGILVGTGGNWIGRKLRFAVQRRFVGRPGVPRFEAGDEVQVYVDGGEMRVNNVLVRTFGATQFPPGRSYLLFLHVKAGYAQTGASVAPLQIADGTLVSLSAETKFLDRLPLKAVVEQVQRIARRI